MENPCNVFGEAVPCERCEMVARHRRELPERAWRHDDEHSGETWLMTVRGPIKPRPDEQYEVVCEYHVRDWEYGVVPFGDPCER